MGVDPSGVALATQDISQLEWVIGSMWVQQILKVNMSCKTAEVELRMAT